MTSHPPALPPHSPARPGRRWAAAFALLVAVPGCTGTPWRGTPLDPSTLTFAPELDVDLSAMERTPTGLYVLDLEEGEGAAAQRTSLVSLRYAAWLPDGTLVDTNAGGEPFRVRLGGSEVVRGWNQGIPGMRIGGRRKLVVRPGLAYGSGGSARVPPNATMVFEVELLDVR